MWMGEMLQGPHPEMKCFKCWWCFGKKNQFSPATNSLIDYPTQYTIITIIEKGTMNLRITICGEHGKIWKEEKMGLRLCKYNSQVWNCQKINGQKILFKINNQNILIALHKPAQDIQTKWEVKAALCSDVFFHKTLRLQNSKEKGFNITR